MLSPGRSPRPSGRRATATSTRASASSSIPSARAAGNPRSASDVFDVVADGNADLLVQMIEFSGAKHLCELRSKKQEDYGQNLLHCAVTNGQMKALQLLLEHNVFDPNQVDSVYTRSTPMMEAVKIGRLDLIECLIRAGGRLDVQSTVRNRQDVNGDSVLHWAAREISAAFLREVLLLARRNGSSVSQLMAVLQLTNNSGENAADVGGNDVARESIRRLVSGEESPGLPHRKKNSGAPRPSQAGAGEKVGGDRRSTIQKVQSQAGFRASEEGAAPNKPRPSTGRRRPGSAATATGHAWAASRETTGLPTGVVLGALGASAAPSSGDGGAAIEGAEASVGEKTVRLKPLRDALLPEVTPIASDAAVNLAEDAPTHASASDHI